MCAATPVAGVDSRCLFVIVCSSAGFPEVYAKAGLLASRTCLFADSRSACFVHGGFHQATGPDNERDLQGGHLSMSMRLQRVCQRTGETSTIPLALLGSKVSLVNLAYEPRSSPFGHVFLLCLAMHARFLGRIPRGWRICLRRRGLAGGG